jgi:hypothetical protein
MLFMLSTGEIQAPQGPLWDPSKWESNKGTPSGSAFARGLFSSTKSYTGAHDMAKAPFDILGSVFNNSRDGGLGFAATSPVGSMQYPNVPWGSVGRIGTGGR